MKVRFPSLLVRGFVDVDSLLPEEVKKLQALLTAGICCGCAAVKVEKGEITVVVNLN